MALDSDQPDLDSILDDFSQYARTGQFDLIETMVGDDLVRCALFSGEGRQVLDGLLAQQVICKDWLGRVGLLVVPGEA